MTPFFRMDRLGGRDVFVDPSGEPFFSLGMNHFDSATLRYPENSRIWREKYGNSQERWIREAVAPDLRDWGFNTIGYVYDIIQRGETRLRNSRHWTFEEFQWADMPYCQTIQFGNLHWQDVERPYDDFFSADFVDWCDYLARDVCARCADDTKLLGYFYADCPTWTFARIPECKGPFRDPELLETKAGRNELRRQASQFYQVCHDAVRRYDPNHLILGDRYEGRHHLAESVVEAALPYVDVLSFQHFGEPEHVLDTFERWHTFSGKPILLADACAPGRDMTRYGLMMEELLACPYVVGWHYCGAYIANRVRGFGVRDENNEIDRDAADTFRHVNRQARGVFEEKVGEVCGCRGDEGISTRGKWE